MITLAVLLAGCGTSQENSSYDTSRVDRIEDGAKRSFTDTQNEIEAARAGEPSGDKVARSGERKYIVNLTFSACPEASDWFTMQDAVRNGDYSVDLPDKCEKMQPGSIVFAPTKIARKTLNHNEHAFERIKLADGRFMWTDGLDRMSASDITP